MQAAFTGAKMLGELVQGAGGLEAGKYNRDVLNAQAADALKVSSAQELQVRRAAREQMGKQVASVAESGFTPGTGSALRLLEESATNAELDVLNLRRAAQGKAAALRAQAKMAKNTGSMAMTASIISAGTTLAKAIKGGPGNYGG